MPLHGERLCCYYANKYMETQAAITNVRVQAEINAITRQMIDVKQ